MSDSHRPKHPFKPRFGAEETCVYCYEPADSPFHVIRTTGQPPTLSRLRGDESDPSLPVANDDEYHLRICQRCGHTYRRHHPGAEHNADQGAIHRSCGECGSCPEFIAPANEPTVEGETTMADELHKVDDPLGGMTPQPHEFVAVDDDSDRCVVCCRSDRDISHLRWKAEHPDSPPNPTGVPSPYIAKHIHHLPEMESRVESRTYRYEVVRKLAEKLYLMDVYGAHPDFDDADQLLQNAYVGKARALIADPDLRVELR